MKTEHFIDEWLHQNPIQAAAIARAAIISCCVDRDVDTDEPSLNLELPPDLKDLGDRVTAAIRASSFPDDAHSLSN